MKSEAEVAVPDGVFTTSFPEVVSAGTVAIIWVELLIINSSATPLNSTAVASLKLVPFTVTLLPVFPLEGEKPGIVGAGIVTLKSVVLIVVPEKGYYYSDPEFTIAKLPLTDAQFRQTYCH